MSASHCCGYLMDRGRPCRRHVAGHRLRCPHHSFTKLQSEGRAIRPSALDTYDQCPMRFARQYIQRDVEDTPGRPARVGIAAHAALAAALWAHQHGHDWQPSMYVALGREVDSGLPMAEVEELERMMRWWRPPCRPEDLLLVEPCYRHGSDAELSTEWRPVRLADGTEIWGTPDAVYEDGALMCIYDHKTGRLPSGPDGWAPWIYAKLLAEWCRETRRPLNWPVRVLWRFVRFGEDMGKRELLINRDELDWRMYQLMGRMSRIRESIRTGEWACTPNEYCAYCPMWAECPAMSPSEPQTADEVAGAYLAAVASRRRAEGEERELRARLDAMVSVGDEIFHPESQEPMFRVERKRSLRALPLRPESLLALNEIADRHGRSGVELLRISTSGLDGMADELVEAGVVSATDTVEIRRTSRD